MPCFHAILLRLWLRYVCLASISPSLATMADKLPFFLFTQCMVKMSQQISNISKNLHFLLIFTYTDSNRFSTFKPYQYRWRFLHLNNIPIPISQKIPIVGLKIAFSTFCYWYRTDESTNIYSGQFNLHLHLIIFKLFLTMGYYLGLFQNLFQNLHPSISFLTLSQIWVGTGAWEYGGSGKLQSSAQSSLAEISFIITAQ